ncbi:MAG: hypothetical protein OXC99_00005, partial [Chloroflexi bacterium]|nr:hypothetical protein [Chloroflexota bacterium]
MALSSTVTLRPSGTARTISSARAVSPARHSSARGRAPERVQVGRLRVHRQRARLDASHVQQVAYEGAHMLGPVDDDAVELPHL